MGRYILYILGVAIFIAGLGYALYWAGIAIHWIIAVALMIIGIAIAAGASKYRSSEPARRDVPPRETY